MTLRTVLLATALLGAASANAMELTSPDLKDGGTIGSDQIYPRCGGKNVSPALMWSGVPRGAKSLALTMIDSSVKPAKWSHWIVINLPANSTGLEKGAAKLPAGASALKSNFGDASYDGPCPPPGSGTHHYELTLWALIGPAPAITPDEHATDVEAALGAVSLTTATLSGTVQAR